MTNLQRTQRIFELKSETGSNKALLDALADDVRWTIAGSGWAAGTYTKSELIDNVLTPLGDRLKGTVHSHVDEMLDAGDTIIVRWRGESETTWGEPYNNDYCWLLTWSGDRITRVVAHIDTLLLERIMTHEA